MTTETCRPVVDDNTLDKAIDLFYAAAVNNPSPDGEDTLTVDDIAKGIGSALNDLADAGRLLPTPTEVRVEYRAWLHGGDQRGIRLETESSPRRADVVEWAEEQIGRYGITGYRVMRREHHIFPDGSRYMSASTDWVEDVEGES